MENPSTIIIVAGITLVVIGLLWNFGSKIGLFKLPGDIAIEKENFKFYFPITTSIVISIILSIIFFILSRVK